MILIGRWPLARRLPLLQVQPTVKGVQVRLVSLFNFRNIIYSLKSLTQCKTVSRRMVTLYELSR